MDDEPASKRRRVSPQTLDADSRSPPAVASSSRPRRQRPSFASPTKASLARHNPEILERRRSASPLKSPSRARASDALSQPGLSDLLTAQLEADRNQHLPASEPGSGPPEGERPPPVSSSAAGRVGPRSRWQASRLPHRPSPATRTSRSRIPEPRPLPPPAPDGEDDLTPFIGREAHPPTVAGILLPVQPEPQLPPPVPNPLSSTPPKGIHISPSSLRRRERGSSAKRKSSPLKPLLDSSTSQSGPRNRPQRLLFPARHRRSNATSHSPVNEAALDPTTDRARNVPALDPDAAKKKEKEALQEEIRRLRGDLELVSRENERIRLMQASGQTVVPADGDGIATLVDRYLGSPDRKPQKTVSQQMALSVLKPARLLPLGHSLPWVPVAATERVADLESIKSHHPVAMTAEEELPYLQLFSPFSIASTVAILPPEARQPARQRHQLTLRSRDPPGLFTAKVDITVDALSLRILELSVPALEPSAKAELGPLVDKICTGKCNRTMQRNIGLLAWAMGEWIRVALLRARVWILLEHELAQKDGLVEAVAKARHQDAGPRGAQSELGQEEKSSAAWCDGADLLRFMGEPSLEIQLPVYPGSSEAPSLRLEWNISFDWTGEAQSRVALLVGVPGKCRLLFSLLLLVFISAWLFPPLKNQSFPPANSLTQRTGRMTDEGGRLAEVPKLFDRLMQGGLEVEAAVRTVVALLAGS